MSIPVRTGLGHHENAPSGISPKMDAFERQQIFREMAVGQLRNGPLSTRRRRTLVQFAAGLGINATQAGRLVQQAQAIAAKQSPKLTLQPSVSITPSTHERRASRLITAALWSAALCIALLWVLGV
jgi:hypothetical protein